MPSPPSGAPDPNLALLIEAAKDDRFDADKLDKVMAMIERREADKRKRAFLDARARAKGELPPIFKKHLVDYEHKDRQGRTSYRYEELFDITQAIDPVLAKHGLSYSHRVVQGDGKVKVTCILSHVDGHEEGYPLEGFEDKSGQKSANQSITSTVTFLQRATLKQALGLAAGRDTDGRPVDDPDAGVVSLDEIMVIEQMIRDTESDTAKFLETIGAESLPMMTVGQFKRGRGLLNEKKRRAGRKEATRHDESGSTG